ncbi:MAG: hypothetical protein PHN18_08045 [Sulfurospirillaceae bacterium]|nr:hypothetical protein [Sulfurospirillaceae bacterium]MDD2827901.1 hypothetical protein [Sulfurospirillaceae bacterium]
MTYIEAMEKLSNKTIDIAEVESIYSLWGESTEIQSSIAMNLSLRTSVYDRTQEKSETMLKLLEILANSAEMSVRWAVAKNPHTPLSALEKLSLDNVNLVRALVATNPNTPVSILKKMFNDEKIVRDGLSGNPSTPSKYLAILADDNDAMVRLRVVDNPSCTEAILKKCITDSAENVRLAAHSKLQRK